jgi:hypothetical protein
MKLYNDQRHAQVFNLFIYLLLPYMFRLSFSPSSEAGVQFGRGSSLLDMVSAPRGWHHTKETWNTAEHVHLPLKMG